jgi:rhamnosyltransferase
VSVRARVSAVIPTWNGAATLPPLLAALQRERRARRGLEEIVAIDSGSRDATVELLRAAGARVLELEGEPYGHGTARNRAAAAAAGEALLFLTQDIEPVGEEWLPPLLAALDDAGVAGAFGRQVPRGASLEEAFLARVNYPGRPRRLRAADLPGGFGPGAILFSNAFALVRRAAWEAIPFPSIVMSEDQAWALSVLRAGQELRYEPRAQAYHGHRFSLWRAFRRNFDSGSSLQRLGLAGGSSRGAAAHLARELRWVASRGGPWAAAHALLYESVRATGFLCGRLERVLPRAVARTLGEAPRP